MQQVGRVFRPSWFFKLIVLASFSVEKPSMRKFGQAVVKFLKGEDGPTAVEYAVMLALIIVVCITAITTLGTNANATFQNVAAQVGNTGS
jgi:pilus assembly protein Flp/PilA